MIHLGPIKRRVVYVTLFETLGILLSTLLLMALSGSSAQGSLPIAVAVSTLAVIWNFAYNTLFETWEQRNKKTVRNFKIRCLHAVGFEGGLVLFTLPLYMFWYGVGVWKAFTMVAALLIFFLIYTFVFTLLFDNVFALPNRSEPKLKGEVNT